MPSACESKLEADDFAPCFTTPARAVRGGLRFSALGVAEAPGPGVDARRSDGQCWVVCFFRFSTEEMGSMVLIHRFSLREVPGNHCLGSLSGIYFAMFQSLTKLLRLTRQDAVARRACVRGWVGARVRACVPAFFFALRWCFLCCLAPCPSPLSFFFVRSLSLPLSVFLSRLICVVLVVPRQWFETMASLAFLVYALRLIKPERLSRLPIAFWSQADGVCI